MSLFENEEYQWRETYFILFQSAKRPSATAVASRLKAMDPRYEVTNIRENEAGQLESLTLFSPDDYAAMDISFVTGEEVSEQTAPLMKELKKNADPDELDAIKRIAKCDCRFDVFHFEQLVFVGRTDEEDEDDFMDPGALLMVMEEVAQLCGGVVVDPQANSLL